MEQRQGVARAVRGTFNKQQSSSGGISPAIVGARRQSPAAPRPLITEPEAALRLHVSRTTLWQWRREGRIPFVRLGRVRGVRYREDVIDRIAAEGI